MERTSGQFRAPFAMQLFSQMCRSQQGGHSLHSLGYGLEIVWLARATWQCVRGKLQLPHEVPCLNFPGVVTHRLAPHPSTSQYSFSSFDALVLEGMQLLHLQGKLHFGALLQLELLLLISFRWAFCRLYLQSLRPGYIQKNEVLGAYWRFVLNVGGAGLVGGAEVLLFYIRARIRRVQ